MLRPKPILAVWMCLGFACAAAAQRSAPAPPVLASNTTASSDVIDGIAARIDDDIITDSEVRELGAFQQIVDGKAKPRADLIRLLAEQWIAKGEADATKFPMPSLEDVDHAYQQLAMQFGGAKPFDDRAAAVGLNQGAVRRLLDRQLYLSRFLDYRFRSAVQIEDAQVETYYRDEFTPQVKERGQPVPPLESVEETIREVLVQREITRRANEWLDEARGHLQIEPLHTEGKQ
jgi:hypothetical protein